MKSMKSLFLRTILLAFLSFVLAACNNDAFVADTAIAEKQQVEFTQAPEYPEIHPTDPNPEAAKEDKSHLQVNNDREIYRRGLIEEAQWVLDELPGASVYQIRFTISDDKLSLAGTELVEYTNREDVPLEEIYFQLFPNAAGGSSEISNVTVNDVQVEPVYQPDHTAVQIPLIQQLQPGESTMVEFDFTVDIAQEMAGNYGTLGYFFDVLVLDEFYPVIPVYDDRWHIRIPTNGDLTYLDASFYLVEVTAPKKMELVTSGIELSQDTHGNTQTVVYAAGPARDFYLAGSDKYKSVSKKVGETTINSYAFANRKDGAQHALEAAENALLIFNQRFGKYPYTEMDIASTPLQALGIEYPGIMGVTLDTYDLKDSLLGLPNPVMLESIVAHEVGHQYFYNVVGNNQIEEPWLDEALVQYITALYYKELYGPEGYNSLRDSWYSRWARVDNADIPIGMPSELYTPKEYSPIVYGRGPLFIEALAAEMGEAVFDSFLRDYYDSYMWEISTGEGFKVLAEQHCSCDLTDLFDDWVYY